MKSSTFFQRVRILQISADFKTVSWQIQAQ